MEHDGKCERARIMKKVNVQLDREGQGKLDSSEAGLIYTQPAGASRSCWCKERVGIRFPPTDRDVLVEKTLRWILDQRRGIEVFERKLEKGEGRGEEGREGLEGKRWEEKEWIGEREEEGRVIEVDFVRGRRMR